MSKIYFEEKEVIKYEPTEAKTPLGDAVYKVDFKGGESKELTAMRFQTMQSEKQSDATTARNQLLKAVSQKFYAISIEYGLRISELDALINEFVKVTNDSQAQANCILWGLETEYERSLLDVQRVLAEKYGQSTEEKTDNPDEPAS